MQCRRRCAFFRAGDIFHENHLTRMKKTATKKPPSVRNFRDGIAIAAWSLIYTPIVIIFNSPRAKKKRLREKFVIEILLLEQINAAHMLHLSLLTHKCSYITHLWKSLRIFHTIDRPFFSSSVRSSVLTPKVKRFVPKFSSLWGWRECTIIALWLVWLRWFCSSTALSMFDSNWKN